MRKIPRQARSRATVERILSAGVEVLRQDGFANFSTNAVAREAEVSPGTLYQYFTDRESILDLVIDRWVEQTSDARDRLLRHPVREQAGGDRAR